MKKDKIKKYFFSILFPHPVLATAIILSSIVALVLVFVYNATETFFAPIIYAFSFYGLCIFTARTVTTIKSARKYIKSHKHYTKISKDHEFKTRLSIKIGMIINLLFAVFKLVTGLWFQSGWFVQVAVYYFVLITIRFVLVMKDSKTLGSNKELRIHQWKTYRLCGILLFLLNATISVMVVRVIWQNKGFSYPGFIIYAMAAYTFYRFIIAIIKLVKSKNLNPILLSAKALDLSIALMSMFSLQTAMLTSFGGETPEETRLLLNTFTGIAVCVAIVCIAIIMIFKSNRQIKNISFLSEENQ